jgi:hypothetical protein
MEASEPERYVFTYDFSEPPISKSDYNHLVIHGFISRRAKQLYEMYTNPNAFKDNSARDTTRFARNKIVWLFATELPDDFDKRLHHIIDENSDRPDLTQEDYTLLLYLSYQNDKTQALKTAPMSMLHDMFQPVVDNFIKIWIDKIDGSKLE